MKKIGIVYESISIGGGAEKVVAQTGTGLCEKGIDVHYLLMFDNGKNYEAKGKKIIFNLPLIGTSIIKNIFPMLKRSRLMLKYSKENNLDILICHGVYTIFQGLYVKIFLPKIKIIGVIHITTKVMPRFTKFVFGIIYNFIDKIVLISKEEEIYFQKNFPRAKNKTLTIYNFLDNIEFSQQTDISDKDFHLLNTNKLKLLSVGRLSDQKNQKAIIEAFSIFEKNNKNSILIILGDGELKNTLKEFSKNLGLEDKIYFLGNKKNIYDYMKKSDALIMMSKYEGLPMVIIEAIFSQLPIISYACKTGPTELLSDKISCESIKEKIFLAKNGILIKQNDPELMSEAINIFLTKNIKNAVKSNHQKDIDKFSKEKIINQRYYLILNL